MGQNLRYELEQKNLNKKAVNSLSMLPLPHGSFFGNKKTTTN